MIPEREIDPRERLMNAGPRRYHDGAVEMGMKGEGCPPDPCNQAMACRENARSVIERKAKRLYAEADLLRELLNSLPAKLSPGADEALYQLLEKAR